MKKRTTLSRIRVLPMPAHLAGQRSLGLIEAGGMALRCALGKRGVTHTKREGDNATPLGTHKVAAGWYRADKIPRPFTRLPLKRLRPTDGWCDDPASWRYNRHVTLPFPARHERMWRDDHLYDIVFDLGWNSRPRVRGGGSAIFMHLARANFGPTEGCIAVAPQVVARLLARMGPDTRIVVGPQAIPIRKAPRPKKR